jgi:signal transduction histidine kinase
VRRLIDHPDLWLAALAALGAVAAVILGASPLVRAVVAVPLVLFLPGYALVSMLIPALVIPAVERLLLAAGSSIAVTILAGLALAWSGVGLGPLSWAVTLAVITLVSLAVAWFRRLRRGLVGPGLGFATMPRLAALMVLVAALVAADVVLGSQLIAGEQQSPAPAEMWMLPIDQAPANARLGVRAGADGGNYVVRVSEEGVELQEFSISLRPEEVWERLISFTPEVRARPIVARLYQDASDTEMRYVVLQPATNGS